MMLAGRSPRTVCSNVGEQTRAIRDGEVLLAECPRVDGWRNLGDRDAALSWIVVARRS
jgi:hypothetical protein